MKRYGVALYPMSLIFIALIFLAGPGMLYNNFANSGLNPAQVLGSGGVCGNFAPGVPVDVTCQGSVNAGCQANSTACTLNTSISFLNKNSPFTQLTSGNIFGLFGSLTSNGNAQRGPFDSNGGGAYYHADCLLNFVHGIGGDNNITTNAFASKIVMCTQTDQSNFNMTKTNTFKITAWNFNSTVFSSSIPPTVNFFTLVNNATYANTCLNQGYWYQTTQPQIGYSTIGCDYYKTPAGGVSSSEGFNPALTPIYSFLVAVPCSTTGTSGCKGLMTSGAPYHIEVLVQPELWDTAFCTNAFTAQSLNNQKWHSSQQCINMETWFTSPHTAGGFGTSGNFNFGFFTPFLTMLLGLVLFLIGTGINVRGGGTIFGSGTQFGIGTNRQGTKLAQIMGMALVVYSFMYSQFSVWFTSGVLPNGFDGTTGIVSILISGIFFGGVTWQATTD